MSDLSNILASWGNTEAASERDPLPPGEYAATIESGAMAESRSGTPSYKLKLRVTVGAYAGRVIWHDLYLTPSALPFTKRDLLKLGITDPAQLSQPLPSRFACKAKLARVRSDTGNDYNRVVRFDVLSPIADEPNPFPLAGGAM